MGDLSSAHPLLTALSHQPAVPKPAVLPHFFLFEHRTAEQVYIENYLALWLTSPLAFPLSGILCLFPELNLDASQA